MAVRLLMLVPGTLSDSWPVGKHAAAEDCMNTQHRYAALYRFRRRLAKAGGLLRVPVLNEDDSHG